MTLRRLQRGANRCVGWLLGLSLLVVSPAVSAAAAEVAAPDNPTPPPTAAVLEELETKNPVVARVDGRAIRWRDVMQSAGDLAITRKEEAQALFPVLLEQVIDRELLAAAARREGVQHEASVRAEVRHYEDSLLSRLYLERTLARAAAQDRLWEKYQERIQGTGGPLEIRARHILVKTRAEAEALIAALDDGADFEVLAARHSIGPSAVRGGDLGYFDPARMVEPFSRAALALSPGSYTTSPVETPFGWHVVQLVDLRREGAPPFAALAAALRAETEAAAQETLMNRLRSQAQIEILTVSEF